MYEVWCQMLRARPVLVVLCLLVATGRAGADDCLQPIRDAAKCGEDCVNKTGKCIETFVDCGVEEYKCGEREVTDAAKCGVNVFTDVATCGAKCISSAFQSCRCEKPKTCYIDKMCERPKQCKGTPKCEVVRSCTPRQCSIAKPSCSPLSASWKDEIVKNAEKYLAGDIARARALAKAQEKRAAGFGDTEVARGLMNKAKVFAMMTDAKARLLQGRLASLSKDPQKMEVLKRVLFAVSRREISEQSLKADVKQLDAWLIGDGKTRWASAERQRPAAERAWQWAQGLLGLRSAHAAPHSYDDGVSYSIIVNINGGAIGGGAFGLGVVWDRSGEVRGIVNIGLIVGVVIDVGGDLTVRVHPGDLETVTGPAMGVGGSGAYYGGANAALEWSGPPFEQEVPTWGAGISAGIGGQLAWSFGASFVFPDPPVKSTYLLVNQATGLCLDAAQYDGAVGRAMGVYKCEGLLDQAFRFPGPGSKGAVLFNAKAPVNQNACLTVPGGDSQDAPAGKRAVLGGCAGADADFWEMGTGGWTPIKSTYGKTCLAVVGGSGADKHEVRAETCKPGEWQNWTAVPVPQKATGGRVLISRQKGLCLDPKNYDGAADRDVGVYRCDGGLDQVFFVDNEGVTPLHTGANRMNCLIPWGGEGKPLSDVLLAGCAGGRAQILWQLGGASGWVPVRNTMQSTCLAVTGGGGPSDNVRIETCADSENQRWAPVLMP